MTIKLLTQNIINQIAAGEVIERPASVIKELMENAIDAGSTEITVHIMDAGKSFISVSDNGCGMDKSSLELCILSHATSKLDSENLFDIHTFGFRGEALPSISSISRVSIISAQKIGNSANNDETSCWKMQMEGANIISITPDTRSVGTTIEVRDLFFATPARLKFLKSNLSETENCREVFMRIAMAFPQITFKFLEDGKLKFNFLKTDSLKNRINDVLGSSFSQNTFFIDVQKQNLKIHGAISVPTYNRATSSQQYFFVNGRFVKDKIFFSAIRAAYSGLVPQGRYAVAVVFLEMPFNEVDVNAHPSKIEVRFKDSEAIRYFISSELKNALSSYGSNHPSSEAVDTFHVKTGLTYFPKQNNFDQFAPKNKSKNYNESLRALLNIGNTSKEKVLNDAFNPFDHEVISTVSQLAQARKTELESSFELNEQQKQIEIPPIQSYFPNSAETDLPENDIPDFTEKISLGTPLFQIHNTYIVASDEDNLIIVDQHAAAERITLEKLKAQGSLDSQMLLMPELLSFSGSEIELIEKNLKLLNQFGIFYEKKSDTELLVTALPSILGSCEVKPLMQDVAEELKNFGEAYSLEEKIHLTLSTISCHGSLRAGRKLNFEEMNSLLRQMENSPNIAQCCHGRPSYVKYSYKILNNFFERH